MNIKSHSDTRAVEMGFKTSFYAFVQKNSKVEILIFLENLKNPDSCSHSIKLFPFSLISKLSLYLQHAILCTWLQVICGRGMGVTQRCARKKRVITVMYM